METDKTRAENSAAPDTDQAGLATGGSAGESAGESGAPQDATAKPQSQASAPREVNGPKGPEPTRYGDWEQKGRCSDF
ncbi:MAG TPA: DUF1674 domain-containing protein [Alphaproteobacteria bacterium]|jgi:hypothetical protein|nr:DUF1674 domain-containing protein [Alphaproteobacteria bacterium]